MKRTFRSREHQLWEILWKSHIRPLLEHAIQSWSPYQKTDIDVLERVQRAVTKHIHGMKGLTYEQRLAKLKWTTLRERRERGDAILIYQHLHNNVDLNLNTWHWAKPLSELHGPASSVRANEWRLNPPVKYKLKQREHFITTRIEAPIRALPSNILTASTVNEFKNAYDAHKHPR